MTPRPTIPWNRRLAHKKIRVTPFVLSTNGLTPGWRMRATSAASWRARRLLSSWTQITWVFRVSFLPNVLCLYRHHETSMSNATNLFDRELVSQLIKKYHALVETYPPKNRILGVDRLRFEEAVRTIPEKRKRADVLSARLE